ncbi:putative ribonuclease H-like domain-containing protein [Tanacetum coccineum]|uniref:Ribonuclease H-like domain-containing protein n=1 Tax=Tanacetum coccineum TaxID=301880 RepID=A0ABQ5C7H1_9ASTR
MSSMQEDIQCAGRIMREYYEDHQRRTISYGNGLSDVIAGERTDKQLVGAVQQGSSRVARVLNRPSHAEEMKGYELNKGDDRESQLYEEFETLPCQNKGETIQGYYVRFTKLINDMRNIKMTMSRMQLNSKFVNNMLPEWSRFITEVKLNRGLKESNCDQLYAYLKQHEVHANENRIMMERFIQPNNDPLALVSDASVQQYPTQSSKSPQPSKEPSPADNFQLDSGSSSTENLIESLSNTLALLTQSYKSHLPQTNNQLRASSNARNKAMVQDGKVVVQDVRGRYNATNQGRPFQRNNARGSGVAGNVGGQNRGGMINPGQAKPIKCYNCNGLGHIARECPRPKRLQDSDYFKDKMLLMQAQESGAVLDEEQSLFLAGEQVTNVDDDVDDSPENDLALNVDHIFEADECDAFDSDVDEGPTSQTMFMANLTSEDPIYDEAGPSYDSNNPFEVMLWYLDSGCSKHMTGNRSKLMNFVEKFIGSVRFKNDHLGAIMGYGDYGLESVTAFVRDIKGTDILKGSRGTNLYTISIDEMMKSSPICLLSKAPSPKIMVFEKDHLCSACQLGKSKKFSHRPKSENTNMEVLHTLHMDLCGPMRVQSIKGSNNFSLITLPHTNSQIHPPQIMETEFVNQVMFEYYEGCWQPAAKIDEVAIGRQLNIRWQSGYDISKGKQSKCVIMKEDCAIEDSNSKALVATNNIEDIDGPRNLMFDAEQHAFGQDGLMIFDWMQQRFGIESSNSMESDISSGDETLTDSTYENFKREKAYKAVPPPTDDDEETDVSEVKRKLLFTQSNSETSFENRSPNSQNSVGQESRTKGLGNKGGMDREDLESQVITISRSSTTRTPHRHKTKKVGNPEEDLKDYAIIDSGCSGSMTGDKDKLSDFKEFKGGYVAFGNDSKGGRISGKGTIKTSCLDFEKVSYVEELKFNLLSVSQICDKKHNVLFTDKECLILSPKFKFVDEDLVILRAPRKNDVYSLDLKNIIPSGGITCLVAKATEDEAVLWHRRLGHVNFKNINKLVKGNLVRGLPSKTFKLDHSCLACRKGKQHRASCKKIEERTVREPLELLHMDLFGPVSVESINKKKYCLVVTDDCSKFSWVFFLAYKDETYDMLHDLIVGLENRLRHKVKTIRCDHGTEFKNQLMNEFCAKKGIKREYSIARTPQQNGVAERKNRTLIEAARTMLADSLLPIQFWAEAVNTACYVLNRVLVTKPQMKTPYEILMGRSPNISFMRPFGCSLTILNTLDHLGKFDGKSEEGYLLGYSTNSKGFRVYNRVTRKVQDCLHVNFLENQENQKGKGPDWMFDLDLLTPSMNYIPVRKENYADSKEQGITCDDAEDLDDQQFIVHTTQPMPPEERTAAKEVKLSSEDQALHDELVSLMHQESLAKAHNDDQRIAFEEEKRRISIAKGKEHVDSTFTLSTANTPPQSTGNTPTDSDDDTPTAVPPGFEDPAHPNKVYRIVKALYGLHQAPRACTANPTQSTARQGTITPRTLNFEDEAGPSSPLRPIQVMDSEEQPSKKPKLRTETIDELRNYLRVVDFEKNAQDKESLEGISMITELQVIDSPDGEYLIIHRANNHFRAFDTLWEILHNPVLHSKTKHIQIRHHFIRDCYEQRLINVVKVHTDDNVADLLTKGFDLARFNFLVVNEYLTTALVEFDPDLIGPWLQQFWATASLRVINEVPHIRSNVAGKG